MATLQSRLTDLINAIGADVKLLSTGDEFGPTNLGFKTWAYDPAIANTGQVPNLGTLYLTRLLLSRSTVITSLSFYVQTAGASLTNVGVACYSSAGALLTSVVNSGNATTTNWQSTGLKTVTITSQTIAAGAFYAGFWATGTTAPSMLRTASGGSTFNAGTTLASGTGLRFAVANTGLTNAAPATATQTGNSSAAMWAAAA